MYRVSSGAALAIALCTTAPALAQNKSSSSETFPNGWLMTVRGNVIASPVFPGSDKYGFVAFPSFAIRKAQGPERYSAWDDGVSIVFFGDSQWAVGAVGRYQTGRYYQNDRQKLYGIQDAKWALEPGLFGEFWALKDTIRMRGELRYGINGYNGLIGSLALDYVHRIGQFAINTGPRMTIAGSEYMDTYFGVTQQDALFNGRVTPYSPDAGVKSVGWAAAATYRWNDQWTTTVGGNYDRLVGPAGDSPIAKSLGTRDQFTFGATVGYTFPLGYAP
ncbi:MipA/OmpV family protein [Alsobacter sp. R-9]